MQKDVEERFRQEFEAVIKQREELEEKRQQPEYFFELLLELFKEINKPKSTISLEMFNMYIRNDEVSASIYTRDKNTNEKVIELLKEIGIMRLEGHYFEIANFLKSLFEGKCKEFKTFPDPGQISIRF